MITIPEYELVAMLIQKQIFLFFYVLIPPKNGQLKLYTVFQIINTRLADVQEIGLYVQ